MRLIGFATLVMLALGSGGCSAIDNLADCHNVCQRWADCFDSSYNVSACRDRCRANSNNPDFASNVNRCDACIGGRSCTGAAFSCAGQCGSIITGP